MMSEKRSVGDLTVVASGRFAVGLKTARPRPSRGVLTKRALGAAILSLALAGCSVVHGPWSTKQSTSVTRPSAQRKAPEQEKSGFGSWFKPKEPEPLRTTNDWMALEQIRP